MVVILVPLLLLVVKNHLLLRVVDRRLEDLVRPLVLPSPVIFLRFVLEVVVADIGVPVGDADIDPFVFEDPGDLSQHLLGVLFGVGAALGRDISTRMESSSPLSMTQSKVSF